MSSILYILTTTGFPFLIQIQWCYFHWNRVRIDTDISWILKINEIHQNIPHLEYFPKREDHPKCNTAIHLIWLQKGWDNKLSVYWTSKILFPNWKPMSNAPNCKECWDWWCILFIELIVFIEIIIFIELIIHRCLEQSRIDIHMTIDYKNDHDDWLQNIDWLQNVDWLQNIDWLQIAYWLQNNDWLHIHDWLQIDDWLQNVDWLQMHPTVTIYRLNHLKAPRPPPHVMAPLMSLVKSRLRISGFYSF